MTTLKKHSHKILIFCLTAFFLFGCDEVFNGENRTVKALKEALTIGIEKSVDILSAENGYLDSTVKILLPQEAQTTFNAVRTISQTPGLNVILSALDIKPDLEETLITLINRAASDAAPKAVGIFTTAITDMTISDGTGILFGANNAATQYLEDKTYTNLQAAFRPSITASLNSDNIKVAGYTPMGAWDFFATQNNLLADKIAEFASKPLNMIIINALPKETQELIFSIKPVETNLSDYVTGKALDGLFVKVADEELNIRTNVAARITPLLQEVFGQLDK